MDDTSELVEAFERLAEKTYGEDTTGEDMATIQRWHFTSQVGLDEDEYTTLMDNATNWLDENAPEDPDEPAKLRAGYGLYKLATALKKTKKKPSSDPTFY